MQKSERIKAEVSLREVAEAAGVVWDTHKTLPRKGDWWAPCPLHGENTASFHVVEPAGTGGFFKCFGCHEGGTVIDFTMKLHGIDFVDAIRRLATDAGIVGELSEDRRDQLERKRLENKRRADREAKEKSAAGQRAALSIWRRAKPAGEIVAEYLMARGVRLPAIGGVPPTLRQIDNLAHRENGRNVALTGPAMVAPIGRGTLLGVHRTWITPSGRARHGDGRKVAKQWLGYTGKLMGLPAALSPPSPAVVVGEGIETTLAAFSALHASGRIGWSAEAALSRGAITGPAQDPAQLWTPRAGTTEVLILGEGSEKNPRQARELYEGAAARLKALGLDVLLTVPHGRWDIDADFADIAASELLEE